jgi:hypothetical protein
MTPTPPPDKNLLLTVLSNKPRLNKLIQNIGYEKQIHCIESFRQADIFISVEGLACFRVYRTIYF